MGNLFIEERQELICLETRDIMDEEAVRKPVVQVQVTVSNDNSDCSPSAGTRSLVEMSRSRSL